MLENCVIYYLHFYINMLLSILCARDFITINTAVEKHTNLGLVPLLPYKIVLRPVYRYIQLC